MMLILPALIALGMPGGAGLRAAAPPKLGMWVTVWWTRDDKYHHWSGCHRLPRRGVYGAGEPEVIREQYDRFRDLGVDFLIMDDTNGVGNDGGCINDNIRAWFDFMDARPAGERIPICIGGGGEMRDAGAAGQKRAADYYWSHYARRPSYFQLGSRPLLLVDTDRNYGPGDYADERFAVRWAYNGDNGAAMSKGKTWGWGCFGDAPILHECMSIWPGHRFAHFVAQQGRDPQEEPREGGRRYVRNWLRVLEAKPEYVAVADWNNWQEETAIEDSWSWEDAEGFAAPDLFTRITRACSRLRFGRFVKGEYYREAASLHVYLFDGVRLAYQGAPPTRTAVILAPAGMLTGAGARPPGDPRP